MFGSGLGTNEGSFVHIADIGSAMELAFVDASEFGLRGSLAFHFRFCKVVSASKALLAHREIGTVFKSKITQIPRGTYRVEKTDTRRLDCRGRSRGITQSDASMGCFCLKHFARSFFHLGVEAI